MKRHIIKIDEERCTGCGLCIPNCAEGALKVIDGKARLVSDQACDGLGACIGHCPEGAITVETREAEPFDERKVRASEAIPSPGRAAGPAPSAAPTPTARKSRLAQWPVQLHLLNPQAPYFKGADLLVAADCVPFATADFHERFLAGKALVVFCPKLDDSDEIYVERLAEILRLNDIKSITVAHMEVPCCFGTNRVVEAALKRSGKKLEVKDITISVRGEVKNA